MFKSRKNSNLLESDKKWRMFDKQLIEHAKNNNWGLYRNTRFEIAEFLKREGKTKDALQTYLEICYLDLNGPNNRGGISDRKILKDFPIFDPENSALLAPGIIDRIKKISKKLELDREKIKQLFINHNQRIKQSLKLPLSLKECWIELEKNLR